MLAKTQDCETLAAEPLYRSSSISIGRFDMGPRHPRWSQPNRSHPAPKITFNLVPAHIRLAGHEPVIANPSQVMLYNGSQEYTRTQLQGHGAASTWIQIPIECLGKYARPGVFDPDNHLQPFKVPQLACPAACRGLHRALLTRLRGPLAGDEIAIEEAALDLVGQVFASVARVHPRNGQRASTRRAHAQLVHRAIEYMVVHHREPIVLADVAAAAHASAFHFARVFRQVTGLTVHDCVERLRLASALELLSAYRGNYWHLAKLTGFSNAAHMSTVFHKRLGMPPSRIERAVTKGSLSAICASMRRVG